MTNFCSCIILQRFLLPLVLCGCIYSRPLGISLVYALFLFILPFVPIFQFQNSKGAPGKFLKCLVGFSALVIVIQVLFQIGWIFSTKSKYLNWMNEDESVYTLRQIGFTKLHKAKILEILHWTLPDVVMLFSTIIINSLLRKVSAGRKSEVKINLRTITIEAKNVPQNKSVNLTKYKILKTLGIFGSTFSICFAGVIAPSFINAIYFLTFIGIATWLSCNRKVFKKFAIILKCLAFVLAAHITLIMSYQLPCMQLIFLSNDMKVRLLNMHKIFISIPGDPNKLNFNAKLPLDQMMEPAVLVFSYFVIVCTSNFLSRSSECESLLENDRKREKSQRSDTGSFMEIVKDFMNSKKEERLSEVVSRESRRSYSKSAWDSATIALRRFIVQNCYIITIFVMMIWSIIYHSWFGFVFLITSNIIWVLPDQRRKMMSLSPFILMYAIALLIINYIIDMNIPEGEWNNFTSIIDIQQLGIVKYKTYPFIHLLIKSFLTTAFWMTLNQKFYERDEEEGLSHLQAAFDENEENSVVEIVKKFFAFSWMWIIVLLLFWMAVYGDTLTVFRVANMCFFLFFVLLFQISFNLWKRIMYTYWLILIGYTKVALILIYVYQFDGLPEYGLQQQLRLQKYDKTTLFFKLLSFTLVTILSAIQINYFHAEFLKYCDDVTCRQGSKKVAEKKTWKLVCGAFDKLFMFVEIHFYKFVLVVTFLSATLHLETMHVLVLILLIFAAVARTEMGKLLMLKMISFLSMLYIAAIVLYEFSKTHPTRRLFSDKTQCSLDLNEPSSTVGFIVTNFSEWFKLDDEGTIFQRISSYFIYIVIMTIYFGFKEMRYRTREKNFDAPTIIFEDISRVDADKSMLNMLKFLLNYGYYKFGVEITLITFVFVIFARLDFLSTLYLPFFVFLALRKRHKLYKPWVITTWCVAISVLLQCLLLSLFLIVEPCEGVTDTINQEIHRVLSFLYQTVQTLHQNPHILVYDFMLLLILMAQFEVFNITTRVDFIENPFIYGGNNSSILETRALYGMKIFQHKIYMFNENLNSSIELIKRFIFKCQFWITILIVFLAGTARVDLFSLGYVTGAFIFLWQGTDFYLKPLEEIVEWWNYLMLYNVVAICAKVSIKIFGCPFGRYIPSNYCWLTKMFYIPCADKTINSAICLASEDDSVYVWDGVTFVFILLQLRIFMTYYFYNVSHDTYTTSLLAHRGAQLIENMRIEEVNKNIAEEHKNLEKIKTKMEKMRNSAAHSNFNATDIDSHDVAIRCGDYYMFADDEDDEEDIAENVPQVFSRRSSKSIRSSILQVTRNSEGKVEKINWIIQKTRLMREMCSKFVHKVFNWLHAFSKNHTFIIKVLAQEKKYLQDTTTPLTSFTTLNEKFSTYEKNRKMSVSKKIDANFWKASRKNKMSLEKPENVTTGEFLREMFYFILTYSNLLVFCLVFLNQIASANLLSLPLPISIFLWGTLTFPQPSKTFWVLLIAYTQAIVLIKCIAQFEILWWDKHHSLVKILGIDHKKNFAIYDLILLMGLFIHRMVLKMFGLWKSNVELELNDESYELYKCDEKTGALIKHTFENQVEENSEENVIPDASTAQLIDESVNTFKKVFRHELKTENNKKVMKATYKEHKELLHASEEVYTDLQGRDVIKLHQDDIKIKLNPIDIDDTEKIYSANKLLFAESIIEEPAEFCPSIFLMSLKRYASLTKSYVRGLIPKRQIPRKPVDVYTYMFLCDFINFFVLLFGFTKFAIQPTADDSRNILQYLEENKVPTSLLFLLITQFAVIIIDRMLYLRKNIVGKVIFHIVTIFSTHIWMFFILPLKSKREFNSTLPPIIFYAIKCIYLLLSAYQIRCGYPARIFGNFVMKKFDALHMHATSIFFAIPFLFELRSLIDWTMTPTSLAYTEWIKVEKINAQVFLIKCERILDRDAPRGKTTFFSKLPFGGVWMMIIIIILWFPLIFFAYTPALGQPNIPIEFSITVQLGAYSPLYQMNVKQENFYQFTTENWNKIMRMYEKYPSAKNFLQDFDERDITLVQFSVDSAFVWSVLPPPTQQKILNDLREKELNEVNLIYEFSQKGYEKSLQKNMYKVDYTLSDDVRIKLIDVLDPTTPTSTVIIPSLLPQLLHINIVGKATLIPELFLPYRGKSNDFKRDVKLTLHKTSSFAWWEIKEKCEDSIYLELFKNFPQQNCDEFINVYLFNDKMYPTTFGVLAVKGVIGLYVTILVVVARVLRGMLLSFDTFKIPVTELPVVDKILNLCQNIYLVRESGEYMLEEDLVAKLLFLYRSPELLIKWTRYKRE